MYLRLDLEEVQGERLKRRKLRIRWENKTYKIHKTIWGHKRLMILKIKNQRYKMKIVLLMDKIMKSNNNKNQEERKSQGRSHQL